jgi:hypothetical protein
MRRAALLFAGIALVASAAYSGEGIVRRSARRIPGRYIVVLGSAADAAAVANTVRSLPAARIDHSYTRGLKGFAVEMSDDDAVKLAGDSRVAVVEEDATFSATTISWGLDRIDQRFLPLNGTYVSSGTGAGVTVYVADTGILAEHIDLAGRVAPGFNAVPDGGTTTDCNGHGTHVAGIIAGTRFGVAKSATLVPVRVLDCNGMGSTSTLLAGLDWILQDYSQSPRPAVLNLSLGGDGSWSVDSEVNSLISAGVTTVVAAGNSNINACNVSPARVPAALTVGASTEDDQRASFSNYGQCVDVFAPGSNILSDWYSSPTAGAVTSGTSSAAPFVAGVAALSLETYPSASPSTVAQTIVSQATLDVLGSVGEGSPNRLLFSLIGSLSEPMVADSQLLSDPSFDYGETFWTSDICTIINPTGCTPGVIDDVTYYSLPSRSGNGHAAIGGPPTTFHLMSESVTVPSTVRRAELSFYLWIVSKNKKSSAADVMTVEIRDRNGALLETVGKFSNLDTCATYLQRRFDVSRYRGMTIRIAFTGTQSQGPPTWFVLDDVALNVWR